MHTSQLIETMMGGAVLGLSQEGTPAPAQAGGAESATSGALGGTAVTGADGSTTQGAQGPGGAAGGGGGMSMMLLFMVPVLLFLIFTSVMGGRKEKKKRAEMMSSLKKHDKVQTIGGVIGTVVELGPEEVVLRVDETSKTRIRFSRTAIQQVLRGGAVGAGDDKETLDAGASNGVVEKVGV